MKVEILGWECRDLRCPNFTFDFASGSDAPRKVVLIQMPNGTGKTTTLECLEAALSGAATTWTSDQIRELRSQRSQSKSKGAFTLRLRYDGRPLTFAMAFDFEAGSVRYATTYDRGRTERHSPPPELQRFFSTAVTRLLVFNGELPQALLDPNKTEAESAIDAFFQLHLLGEIERQVEEIWDRRTTGKATEQKGYTRRRNRVIELRKTVLNLERTRDKLRATVDNSTRLVESLDAQIKARVGQTEELRLEQEQLVQESAKGEGAVREAVDDVMATVRRPYMLNGAFGRALLRLRANLEKLRLPESTSKQFFDELAQENECVCGRPLDEGTRDAIRRRAPLYFGTETSATINAMKSDIQSFVEESTPVDIAPMLGRLRGATHARDTVQTRLHAIEQRLIDEGDEELKQLSNSLRKAESDREKAAELLEEIERDAYSSEPDDSGCLKWWQAELERATGELAEITDTRTLLAKTQLLQGILQDARARAMDGLKASIVEAVNQRLGTLLRGHGIRVKAIEQCIKLEKRSGASQGQQLGVGYAFLSTLFSRGVHTFPFVVDAPVTALDMRVSAQVGRLVPSVCAQFVGFVLDREREGFVDGIVQVVPKREALFLTAFENANRNANLLKTAPKRGLWESGDAVIVEGYDYFSKVTLPMDEDVPRKRNSARK